MMRKPALLSITGVAAAILITIVLLFPGGHTPTVQAATIMQKLNEQIDEDVALNIQLERLSIDELFIDGFLNVMEGRVCGDISIRIDEGKSMDGEAQTLEIDAALAVGSADSWLLVRKLRVPDPEVQPFLDAFFMEGTETMILLPKQIMESEVNSELQFGTVTDQLQDVHHLLKEIIAAHEDYGVTLTPQPDGSILLSLPIEDEVALETIAAQLEQNMQFDLDLEVGDSAAPDAEDSEDAPAAGADRDTQVVVKHEASTTLDGDDPLIGSTLTVLYDPNYERVRSFAILDFGGPGSNIRVNLDAVPITEDYFDWQTHMQQGTRLFDLNALQGLFQVSEGND